MIEGLLKKRRDKYAASVCGKSEKRREEGCGAITQAKVWVVHLYIALRDFSRRRRSAFRKKHGDRVLSECGIFA